MAAELGKQRNENSRSSSVIIDVKADTGIEMADPVTSKDYYQNENCRSSQSFQGKDRVGAEKIIHGTSGESSKGDESKMCRICHLANWENSNSEILIQLGCGCKNELGASHLSCAQTWFKLKGNRLCEICGKIALNVSGVEETYTNANNNNNTNVILVVEWDEMGRFRSSTATTARGNTVIQDRERCHRNCRNVVLACLVLAFIVPWLFRINLF
ncbi:RING-CH-type domain-containing protein [Heracleum sosnowskyi]|uniref:RING-CH-type domain-containing protein n=1 Tax=Heracleum sosnowskyi TaxID=360622 RepID=A0AAD8JLR0_9APIA|nr:RING-CH-type domain-containing protein [Heracleum sosnowskyi]